MITRIVELELERRCKFARKNPSIDYFYAPPYLQLPPSCLASPFSLSQNAIVLQKGENLRCSSVITSCSFAKSKVTSATPSPSFLFSLPLLGGVIKSFSASGASIGAIPREYTRSWFTLESPILKIPLSKLAHALSFDSLSFIFIPSSFSFRNISMYSCYGPRESRAVFFLCDFQKPTGNY